jgi:hypothetical protein
VRHRWRAFGSAVFVILVLATACTSAGPRVKPQAPAKGASDASCESAANERDCEAARGISAKPENIIEDLNGYMDWFYGQRAAPGKAIPKGRLEAAFAQAAALKASTSKISANITADSSWVNLGPAPLESTDPRYQDPFLSNYGAGWHENSGRTTDVEVHPNDPDLIYIGTAMGGVWKTTNGGASWDPLFDDQPTLAIGDMELAPGNPEVIYVGTGEASTNQDAYYGLGVFKSTDGGQTWNEVGDGEFESKSVFRIQVRGGGDIVYVATNRGLYKSTNGGDDFDLILAPGNPALFQSFISDMVVLPNSGGSKLIAAVGWRGGKTTNGLWFSKNSGATWTHLDPPGFADQSDIGRTSLAVSNAAPKLVYALVQDAGCFNFGGCFEGTVLNGIYRSTTGPNGPWTMVADAEYLAGRPGTAQDPDKIGGGYAPGVQAWYNQYLEIDPTNPDDVVFGLEEVWNSTDGGDSWDAIGRYWNFCYANPPWPESPWCNADPETNTTTHPDQHGATFVADGSGDPILFVVNDGGIWRQQGPGFDNDSWENLNTNLSTVQFYGAEASSDGTVAGGTQDNGHLEYQGTPEWAEIAGGDGGDTIVHPTNGDYQVEEYVFALLSKTIDGGVTWTQIPPPDPNPRFIAPFQLDPENWDRWAVGGQRIYVSTRGWNTTTNTWKVKMNLGFPRQASAVDIYDGVVYAGWCGPCNPGDFTGPGTFAAGLVTNVGGANLNHPNSYHHAAGNGLPGRYITGVTIDPSDPMHVIVEVSGYARRWIPSDGHGHVFESWDGGENFDDISGDLPDAPANDGIFLDGRLFVGTDVGVYEYLGGGSWATVGDNLPNTSALDLFAVPGSTILGTATHGRGAWTIDIG